MLTFLRELFAAIIGWTLGFLIIFGIPGLFLALLAIFMDVDPGSGAWLLLLLFVAAVWIAILMNPPSWLERLTQWLEM